MRRRFALVILTAVAMAGAAPAKADEPEVRVLAAGAVAPAFKELLIDFARESNVKVEVSFGPVGVLQTRLKNGDRPDVVVLSDAAMTELESAGTIAPGTRAELGRGTAGIAVRAGAPSPDIATPEAVKATMLAARSIAYPDPAGGGTAGVYFAELMAALRHRRRGEEEGAAAEPRLRDRRRGRGRLGRHRRDLHQRTACRTGTSRWSGRFRPRSAWSCRMSRACSRPANRSARRAR